MLDGAWGRRSRSPRLHSLTPRPRPSRPPARPRTAAGTWAGARPCRLRLEVSVPNTPPRTHGISFKSKSNQITKAAQRRRATAARLTRRAAARAAQSRLAGPRERRCTRRCRRTARTPAPAARTPLPSMPRREGFPVPGATSNSFGISPQSFHGCLCEAGACCCRKLRCP